MALTPITLSLPKLDIHLVHYNRRPVYYDPQQTNSLHSGMTSNQNRCTFTFDPPARTKHETVESSLLSFSSLNQDRSWQPRSWTKTVRNASLVAQFTRQETVPSRLDGKKAYLLTFESITSRKSLIVPTITSQGIVDPTDSVIGWVERLLIFTRCSTKAVPRLIATRMVLLDEGDSGPPGFRFHRASRHENNMLDKRLWYGQRKESSIGYISRTYKKR